MTATAMLMGVWNSPSPVPFFPHARTKRGAAGPGGSLYSLRPTSVETTRPPPRPTVMRTR